MSDKLKLILFYILSFTWGILLSLVGTVVILSLIIIGKKPKLFHDRVYIEVGEDWGGCELGCFFICNKDASLSLKQHESGHGIQNIIFGPITPFISSIPSAIRYWLREIRSYKNKYIYGIILALILASISIGIYLVGALLGILSVTIIGALLLLYVVILMDWIVLIETPRYKTTYPDYDDVWFEGTASSWGAKLFPGE